MEPLLRPPRLVEDGGRSSRASLAQGVPERGPGAVPPGGLDEPAAATGVAGPGDAAAALALSRGVPAGHQPQTDQEHRSPCTGSRDGTVAASAVLFSSSSARRASACPRVTRGGLEGALQEREGEPLVADPRPAALRPVLPLAAAPVRPPGPSLPVARSDHAPAKLPRTRRAALSRYRWQVAPEAMRLGRARRPQALRPGSRARRGSGLVFTSVTSPGSTAPRPARGAGSRGRHVVQLVLAARGRDSLPPKQRR